MTTTNNNEITNNNEVLNREGACIPSSYIDLKTKFKDLAENYLAYIVHGYANINGKLIKHSWIEFTEPELLNTIYECVTEQFLNKDEIVNNMKVSDMFKEVKRYNYTQIKILSIKTNSQGGEFEF